MQPRQTTFDHPAVPAEAASVLCAATGNDRNDPALSQFFPVRIRVVASVRIGRVRAALRPAGLSRHRWYGINQGDQLSDVVAVGRRKNGGQWNAVGVRKQVVLRTGLGSIRRVGPSLGPPKTARTLALSATARDQSMSSAPWSRLSSIWWMSCHTPASCQSRRRRQQVIPQPQPISWGRYSHGIPVFKTKSMPVSACRFSMGGRPPLGYARSGGKAGSMIAQTSSVSKGLAMSPSSMTDKECRSVDHHRLSPKNSIRFC